MRHTCYLFRPVTIDNAKPRNKACALTDGGGLLLEVLSSGTKTWRFTYHLNGQREKVTIGAYPADTINQARDRHEELRALVERGESPARTEQVSVAVLPVEPDEASRTPVLTEAAVRQRAQAMRQRIRATVVRRAPQVMVKVTGGGRGMGAIAAHLRYISKTGRLPIEDDRGAVREGKEALRAIADQWRSGGTRMPEVSERREAFNIMLFMPGRTDPRSLQRAARQLAKAELANHRYVIRQTFDFAYALIAAVLASYGQLPYLPSEETTMANRDTATITRDARLEARVSAAQMSLLQQAAALSGCTLGEFVVASAHDAARRVIAEHESIRLSREEQLAFVEALLQPPAPNPRLKRAAKVFRGLRA